MSAAGPVESPCVNICRIAPDSGLCVGCARTPAEIADWLHYTPEERRALMAELPARRAAEPPEPPLGGKRNVV